MSDIHQQPAPASEALPGSFDAIVVGAGFSGLYMLYRLRELGLSARVYEAGDGVGGTWYWNRYPGARCDNMSTDYSYSFSPELEQEWEWTEKYPSQPEILSYLNHVADRFDLRHDIQLNTRVLSAIYDAATNRWLISTSTGDEVSATFFITAVGCLSSPNQPNYKGLETFEGQWYHTGNWPHQGVDFTGKRVGVIGTGSTGIQSIPQIAKQAAHVTVFQRTPNYSLPARNTSLSPKDQARIKARYREIRKANRESFGGVHYDIASTATSALHTTPEERQAAFEYAWALGGFAMTNIYNDLTSNLEANTFIADFVREKIGEIVRDPEVAHKLMPRDHPLGSKRVPIDTEYYETFNRDNVTLVDVRSAPIQEITPTGLRTQAAEYQLDAIVFATGFDAITGSLLKIAIRGTHETLKQKWVDGPRTYLGLMTAGFPNMFTITGPGSPSVLSNMPVSIEQHVEWIADCLAYLRAHHVVRIEPTAEAEDAWVAHVNAVANTTLYPLANSWYLGANIPGKPRIFMPYVGGVGNYRKLCDEIATKGYQGFVLSA